MDTIKAYGTNAAEEKLQPMTIERRDLLPRDVQIEILYCGVCHSDIHNARSEWGPARYPVVPGHEIIGKVIAIGNAVTQFKLGQSVGVGCMVDSCRKCPSCQEGLEQYCDNGAIYTYGSKDPISGGHTFGGYSEKITVDQDFVLHIPENLDLARVAPLLCAGITTYSPLKKWNIQPGQKVGIIGLGGLGHMGIKLAHAMGAHVVMITTSPKKGEDAKLLGADEVLISTNEDEMKNHADSFDFLLNTIPVDHNANPYLTLLKKDCTMVLVGVIEPLSSVNAGLLIRRRISLAGSLIGGIKETQEMLDFCGAHNVLPEVEMINMQYINQAWDRVVSADVKYRFVIDMASLQQK